MSNDLTPHFTLAEATHSDKAVELGLDNTPPSVARENIYRAALGMEAIRSLCGDKPITITSWYRSPEVNRAVGGSETSDHVTGLAVDFRHSTMDAKLVAEAISRSPLIFDQIIWYPEQGRLHVGWGSKMRCQVMTKRNGQSYLQGLS